MVKDHLNPINSGDITLKGFIGERINAALKGRIKCEDVVERIYQETLDAFIYRTDETLEDGAGFWQGEFWGKWMLAVVAAYRYTGDECIKEFIQKSVSELMATQREDGYIGSYEHSDFVMANKEEKKHNWNLWCRNYTLWALVECYELLGDETIIQNASRFMDQLMTEVGPGKVDIMDTGFFIGLPSTAILKPVVMLYNKTGKKSYLEYAEYIVDQWSLHEGQPPNILNMGLTNTPTYRWYDKPQRWAKAYEFMANLEGLLDLYRATGKEDYLKAVTNIYDNLRRVATTVVGSVSFNDKLVCSKYMINILSEICDSFHWATLSYELYKLLGHSYYMDEVEKTLYNVYPAAMNLEGTWGLRRMRHSHVHCTANKHCGLNAHHCCVDSATLGWFEVPSMTVMQREDSILVNLYNEASAKITLPSGNVVGMDIESTYPDEETVTIKLSPEKAERFDLGLRIPRWSKYTTLMVNDEEIKGVRSGDYHHIEREWKAGDVIVLVLDLTPRIIDFPVGMVDGEDYAWCKGGWAKFGIVEPINQPQELEISDAQDHVPAFVVARGPVVLARDIRLGDEDIFEQIPLELENKQLVTVRRIESPKDIWLTFEVDLPVYADLGYGTKTIKMCNFSSAGNTWDVKTSAFNTWQEIKGF